MFVIYRIYGKVYVLNMLILHTCIYTEFYFTENEPYVLFNYYGLSLISKQQYFFSFSQI